MRTHSASKTGELRIICLLQGTSLVCKLSEYQILTPIEIQTAALYPWRPGRYTRVCFRDS